MFFGYLCKNNLDKGVMVDFMEDENVLYSQKRKYCAEQGLFYSYLSAKLFLEIINEVVFVKCYEIGNMNSNIM